MVNRIIAFTGKARSGKDTSCTLLQSELEHKGFKVKIFAFADNLKRTAQSIFKLTEEDLYGKTKETPQKFCLNSKEYVYPIRDAMYEHCRVNIPFHICEFMADALCEKLKQVGKKSFWTMLGFGETYWVSSRQIQQIWGSDVVRECLNDLFWIEDLDYRVEDFLSRDELSVALVSDVRFDSEVEWLISKNAHLIEVKRSNAVEISSHKSENGINSKYQRDIIENNGTLLELKQRLLETVNFINY